MSYPPNHPDPAKRNATAPRARVGEQVFINVAAYSRSADFSFMPGEVPFVQCQVWVCTGANGVGPISALASSGGAAGIQGIVLGDIFAPDYNIASVLWTPQATDNLAFDANGAAHVCIAANLVYVAPAGATVGPRSQGQFLPQFSANGQLVRTIFPCGDGPLDPRSAVPIGHFQGQKNIQVLSVNAARAPLQIAVGGRKQRRHTVWLEERIGLKRLPAVLAEHLLADPAVALEGGRPRRQRMVPVTAAARERLDPKLAEILQAAGRIAVEPLERARLARGGRLVLADRPDVALQPARRALDTAELQVDGAAGLKLEVLLTPGEPRKLLVNLPAADDKAGTVRVFDVAERDEDGALVGGTTFITLADS